MELQASKFVIASEAKQSRKTKRKDRIASSQELLAMTNSTPHSVAAFSVRL